MKRNGIPRHWKFQTLQSRQAPDDYSFVKGPLGSDLTSKDYVSQPGVPVIRGTNLGGEESRFVDDGFVYVSEEKADSLRRNLAYRGDLVFTQRDTLGQVAIIPSSSRFSRYVISQIQMKLTVDPATADTRYVYYAFQSPASQQILHSRVQATGVPHINLGILREFEIPLPPLSEQKRIADILDKADTLRRKRQQALKEFETLRAAVFERMFSSQLKTAEWTSLEEYLVELRYGTSNKSGDSGYVTLRIPNIVRGIIDFNDLKTVPVSESELENLRLTDGDILLVRTNGDPDYVGRCSIFSTTHMVDHAISPSDIIYASYLIRARLHMDRLRPVFLLAYLQTTAGRKDVREKCRTSSGQYNINTKGVSSLRVPKIAMKDQITFEDRLESLHPMSQRLVLAQADADVLFRSLVQRAFNGDI